MVEDVLDWVASVVSCAGEIAEIEKAAQSSTGQKVESKRRIVNRKLL